jgi:hypothetical protein
MLTLILQKQKQKKYLWLNIISFASFMTIYTMIDYFNIGYPNMLSQYGWFLVVGNIFLNIIMSLVSMLMLSFTSAQLDIIGKQSKAHNLSFLSVLFGILTYGCTPCIIAFFASIGIAYSVALLPLAGLPYKLVSLAIVILGFIWILFQINRGSCKIKVEK